MGNTERTFSKPKHWRTDNKIATAWDDIIKFHKETGQTDFVYVAGEYVPLTDNIIDWASTINPTRVTSQKESDALAKTIKLNEYDTEFFTYYPTEYTEKERLQLLDDWLNDNTVLASDKKFMAREVLTKLIDKLS